VLFAFGTAISSYSGTAVIGAAAGTLGMLLLLVLDGSKRRR
jgi:hypothetical protein